MNTTPREALTILRCPRPLRQTALEMVLGEIPAPRRTAYIASLLNAADQGHANLDGLWIAQRGSQLAGAVWAQLQLGRVASVWIPRLAVNVDRLVAESLLRAVSQWLATQDIRLAQLLVGKDAPLAEATLQAQGFRPLADLVYMICLAAAFPVTPPALPFALTPVADSFDPQLAAIIEQTYRGTLDCPQLNGVRAMHDVLQGYKACGNFDRGRWLIAHHAGERVGCLLLTDHPDEDQGEILYIGLAPAVRGRGWGLLLTRHAQWLARRAQRARLVLAVDALNLPALEIYEAAGFIAWDRRQAFLQVFPDRGVTS